MTDSNPLMSLIAKAVANITGKPRNLLGYWCALCFLLQPLAAIYAMRGFAIRRIETAIAGGVFAICFPALLARTGHVNLLGHFYLLFALGIAIRDITLPRRVTIGAQAARFILLFCAILSHPYLFVFSAMILSTRMWGSILRHDASWPRETIQFALLISLVMSVYWLLSQTFGGGAIGFTYYSMNLLSPFWPHGSWFFPKLPMMDATGGQYEGYNYLGMGAILACAFAAPQLRHVNWRRWSGLVFVLVCLFLLALSTIVYAGHFMVLSLGRQPWSQIFGFVQSSGRAFWAVGYFVTLAALSTMERFPRRYGIILLVAFTGLQILDTSPLHNQAQAAFSGRSSTAQMAGVTIPPDINRLTIAELCIPGSDSSNSVLELAAIRSGASLTYIRASRPPPWYNCDIGASDSTELPIAAGELRAFYMQGGMPAIRDSVFSTGAQCAISAPFLLCSLHPALPHAIRPATIPIPRFTAPTQIPSAMLPLGYGWVRALNGLAWSEGPRATLLFTVNPASLTGQQLQITLTITAIAFRSGGMREITATVDGTQSLRIKMRDGSTSQISIAVLRPALPPSGLIRITFDTHYPVNPLKRHIAAPVARAAIILRRISLSVARVS